MDLYNKSRRELMGGNDGDFSPSSTRSLREQVLFAYGSSQSLLLQRVPVGIGTAYKR
jgi:hypothetical protein